MNIHKNARLTFARRMEMVRNMVEVKSTPASAAAEAGVSEPTARKWLGRYLAEGTPGWKDRSSCPRHSPRRIKPEKAMAIAELRRRRLTQARIASSLGISKSTVGRVLARAGLSRLRDLVRTREDAVAMQHQARQRLHALLLRHDIRYVGKSAWTQAHRRWIAHLKLPHPAQQIAFEEYVQAVHEAAERLDR